jgi:uncharacterized membrane protein
VCARCTGILAGYLAYPLFLVGLLALPAWLGVALNLPAVLDAVTQAQGRRVSTNWLRLATGVLSGIGQVAVISWVGRGIGRFILSLSGG